jgi:hypothetical protein
MQDQQGMATNLASQGLLAQAQVKGPALACEVGHSTFYRVYKKNRPKWEISSNSDIPQNLGYFL